MPNATQNFTLTVNKASTTTLATSSANPSLFGQTVTFTATVVSASGSFTPGGTVQFKVDGSNLGSPVSVSACSPSPNACAATGIFSLAVTAGTPHTVEADYSGDGNYSLSFGTLIGGQTVNKANTTTAVASSVNPSTYGQAVTFTAAVTPSPSDTTTAITGSVTFKESAATLGTAPITDQVFGGNHTGTAEFATTSTALATGAHSITAAFNGDGNFNGSTSGALAQTVDKASTTTTITSDLTAATVVGQTYTVAWTVTANAPGSGTPTSTVTVSDGLASCSASVATGQCSLTSPSAGAKTVTATYAGDSSYNNSASGGKPHTVNPASTATTITAHTPNPSIINQPVTVNFTVSVNAPGSGTATGNVTVSDGTGDSCVGTVAVGTCQLTPTTTDNKTLTATYATDGNFAASTSAGVSHTSGQAPVITSANNAAFLVGTAGSFTVTATGFPTPTLSETGTLPSGVTFNASTGVLSGTPTTGGTYSITFTASDGVLPNATQSFTLTVNNPLPIVTSISPSAVNFGSPNTTLTVSGTGFTLQSTVTVGSASITPTFVSSTQLRAVVPAAQLSSPGVLPVTVVTPPPGGGTSSPAMDLEVRDVNVSPSAPTLDVNETQQFTAAVFGAPGQTVTWWVNDVQGGDSTAGTISAAGLYIAPGAVPTPNTVIVKAVSVADPTKSGISTVTVSYPASDNYPRPGAGSIIPPNPPPPLAQVPVPGRCPNFR